MHFLEIEHTMKKTIGILGSVIVILAVIYFGTTYYVTHQAKTWAKQAFSTIKAEFPRVQDLRYQSIHAGVLGLFNNEFSLHQVSFRLKDLSVPVVIDQLTLKGVSNLNHKPTGNVTIAAHGLHLDSLKQLLLNQAKTSKDKSQQNWVNQIPASFNPNINLTLRYNNDEHRLIVNGSLYNGHHTYFTKDSILDHVLLNNLHNIKAIEQALKQAYISSSKFSVHINIDHIQLAKDNSEQSELLKQFGLKTLSVHVNGTGLYQDRNLTTRTQFTVEASKLFKLTTQSTTRLQARFYLKPLIEWLNTPPKQRKHFHVEEKLQHLSITYHDNGLMPLLFNHVVPMFEGAQPSVAKRNIVDTLMAITTRYPSAQLKHIITQLNQFVLAPKSLTITLAPQPPMSYAQIKTFIDKLKQQDDTAKQALHQQEQQYQAKTGKPLPKAQHAAMVKHYQNAVAQQLEQFFTRIGLSVKANTENQAQVTVIPK